MNSRLSDSSCRATCMFIDYQCPRSRDGHEIMESLTTTEFGVQGPPHLCKRKVERRRIQRLFDNYSSDRNDTSQVRSRLRQVGTVESNPRISIRFLGQF
jgi:hypothetical protein